MHKSFAAHPFSSLEDLAFDPHEYSRLKFGSDIIARKFGYDLALRFFKAHAPELMANQVVVIPSPYNFVPNAATILARHFVDRLNHLMVNANGASVELSLAHRKVTYTSDYGFLSAHRRKELISNDHFYLNRKFIKGKLLVFIDDVRITGTHEHKLVDVLEKERLSNDCFFIYYGDYINKDVGCDIEAKINFASISNLADYQKLTEEPNHHLIVRPIKFLLTQSATDLKQMLEQQDLKKVQELYNACLGEGYYRIPQYQEAFKIISTYTEGFYALQT